MPRPVPTSSRLHPKALAGRLLRALYHRLPLTAVHKRRLKSAVYRVARPLIEHTRTYRHWREERDGLRCECGNLAVPIVPPPMIPLRTTALAEVASRLVLPCADEPEVTILIAVHDQIRFTLCCLESIARHWPAVPIEIILVDDASSDETATLLPAVTGLRVIRNPANLGFLRSVNLGANLARGRYLHLLNNDTQVQAGWLDALLAALRETPAAGLAGSKLIYPSGHLQEAGAALKRDGQVELIGLNAHPGLARYQRRRCVDHCSAASVLIEKALFDRLGGLDEAYAPAYYEDCDLSLRVLASDLRVVYEPRSVVIHHLSVSINAQPEAKLARIAANRTIYLERWRSTLAELDSVRLIAFYLPQFHPIAENDRWWGKGFTEWTNVTRARPFFSGHHQPRLPADLGFYDLRLAETRIAQADLAREYGIHGFCYYYYWFNGRRLLHRPLEEVLASGAPDFPFCICWANENWTRRWDGRDAEILMEQAYSDSDDLAFIRGLRPLLSDHRYIRIQHRPLILVYRIESLPDAARTAALWREECRRMGIGEIVLASVQSFGVMTDPTACGFDVAVEFPPHQHAVPAAARWMRPGFKGRLFDYPAMAERFICAERPDYPVFRTVMPSWDNTARRREHAHIYVDATPTAYEHWLARMVEQTRLLGAPGERLVFINAWNEWAEGNYLEPDQRWGRAYLEATRRALGTLAPSGAAPVVEATCDH